MIVADADAAAAAVGLSPAQRVADLAGQELEAFARLVGFTPGGPVVARPTPAETAARRAREAWKAPRLGQQRRGPCLVVDAAGVERARQALAAGTAPEWLERLVRAAGQVAALPRADFVGLIPARAPWNAAGSFCPACVGTGSDVAIHAPFWHWRVERPAVIACPHCGIEYPHADYPETGRLELPRLGLAYDYYLTPRQRDRGAVWRDGTGASSFGGGPTHVSLSGEVERCALNWVLGQLEPLALAAAITGDDGMAGHVAAALERLAEVYPAYPLYTYRQEYYDCDPAWAVAAADDMPAAFRRAACLYTFCGRFDDAEGLHGRGDSTVGACLYPRAEWGASRLAREKASHGQLFLTLLHAYDLVAARLDEATRRRIEAGLLLEYYLDVKGLTTRIDNKSGPGTAARVAAGRFWDDGDERADGIDRFRQLLAGQFHEDGSWRETPIYGAKALIEGLWEVPELEPELYQDERLRRAFALYAEAATPVGTQPSLDDSQASFALPAHLRDLARLRLGLSIPAARTAGAAFGGYVARLDLVPAGDAERAPGDGGRGFHAVGHIHREAPDRSWVPLLCGSAPDTDDDERPPRPALTRFLRGRGLACLGLGAGPEAVQLYLDGGDGLRGHRHLAPLSLAGYAGGFEVFPDLGYIADHPANAWIRATAAHNTVLVDGGSVQAAGRCQLHGWVQEPGLRFVDVSVPVSRAGDDTTPRHSYRRALVLLSAAPDDDATAAAGPELLVDVFDVAGEGVFDYIVRAGDPGPEAQLRGVTTAPRSEPLFADHWATPPWDVRSAGPLTASLEVRWGQQAPVGARVLTAADEVMTFRSPAWRTQADVFEDPERAWTALVLRRVGTAGGARFVVLYALGGDPPPARLCGLDPVVVECTTDDGTRRVTVGPGSVDVLPA